MPFTGFYFGDMSPEDAMSLYQGVVNQTNATPGSGALSDPADLGSFPLTQYASLSKVSPFRGRRMRTLIQVYMTVMTTNGMGYVFPLDETPKTWGELYEYVHRSPSAESIRERLNNLPYRQGTTFMSQADRMITSVPEPRADPSEPFKRDPELHPVLQDLGWILGWELTQACQALDDPDVWYPGVDEGIEPVSDEQVELVIWASQRELNRELRSVPGQPMTDKRPAAPLWELPWPVKRAYAERRRWHYLQYGLGRKQWESNRWSWFDVKEDPDWLPPWLA